MTFSRVPNSDLQILENEGDLHGVLLHEPLEADGGRIGETSSDRGITVLKDLLRGLDPYQRPGVWVYAELAKDEPCPAGTAFTVIEDEYRTVVLLEDDANAAGLQPLFRAAWITLRVHSALEAFGLVAQVSSRLGDAAIPCNIIAGARHDHILVPHDQARTAMKILRALQLQE